MSDLLLTHGYFLYEDPKEMQILKPYVFPWASCTFARTSAKKGFDVEVFDTTFSSKEALSQHLQNGTALHPRDLTRNLMTRKRVVEILRIARLAGWKTVVGGPEPGALYQRIS